MADVTVTTTNVLPVTTGANPARMEQATFGPGVVRGKPVYFNTTDSKWKLADNNVSNILAGRDGLAIAMSDGGDGQPGVILRGGDYVAGGTLVLGESYYLS